MTISSSSIKRILIPVALASLFGGGALLLSHKKSHPTQASSLTDKPAIPSSLPNPLKSSVFKCLRDGGFYMEQSSVQQKPGEVPETQPTESGKSINNLGDLFQQLKDRPKPQVNANPIKIKIDLTGVCDKASTVEKPGISVAFYSHENIIGYAYISSLEMAQDYLNGSSLYGITDLTGNLIGFRERINFYKGTFDFMSLGGREVNGQEEALGENYIYGPQNGSPIGRLSTKTGEFEDRNGKIAGKLQPDRIYLPLFEAPNCYSEDKTEAITFLVFSTTKEFEAFVNNLQNQLLNQ